MFAPKVMSQCSCRACTRNLLPHSASAQAPSDGSTRRFDNTAGRSRILLMTEAAALLTDALNA